VPAHRTGAYRHKKAPHNWSYMNT